MYHLYPKGANSGVSKNITIEQYDLNPKLKLDNPLRILDYF